MADLHGFTPFAEATSPDQVVTMLNTYYGAVVPVILESGGTVLQFVGDAVMAIWGAPTRQPDHAVRAAGAALTLHSVVEAAAECSVSADWPRFRVGINTGPALVGNIGAEQMRSFTAVGDTMNLAARLQNLAEPGQRAGSGSGWPEHLRGARNDRPRQPARLGEGQGQARPGPALCAARISGIATHFTRLPYYLF
ncbi:adenylate/guanylate cyclase domain-containing protein [Mycobacterium genavense]|uniref:adenylate/guanylate cyclase domain-containing protein n=1 Tax=Mycobacterium genavense TaxID=36812 RepID=UPI001FE12EB8|nr:adenylate/guanylate cyclase domain-containing protein [Mycobacterium genavense]